MSRPLPKRYLPHTVTIFNFISEGVYQPSVISNVYISESTAAGINELGSQSRGGLFCIVDCQNSKATDYFSGEGRVYTPAKSFDKSTEKENYFTFHDELKDILVVGSVEMDILNQGMASVKKECRSFAVKTVDTVYHAGENRIHHWEITTI